MPKEPSSPDPLPQSVLDAAVEIWSRTGARQTIRTTGISMLPLIQNGDELLVMGGVDHIRPGDVVVFRQREGFVAHRVLRVRGSGEDRVFITKGDNTPRLDPPVPAARVLGRVSRVSRGERHLDLDAPTWRLLGRLLAGLSLAALGLFAWGQRVRRRLLRANHPLSGPIHRTLQRSFLALRRGLLRLLGW